MSRFSSLITRLVTRREEPRLREYVPSELTQKDVGPIKSIEEIRAEGTQPIVYGESKAPETSQVVRVASMESLENSRKAPGGGEKIG